MRKIKYKMIYNGNSWEAPYCSKCKNVFWPAYRPADNFIECPICHTRYWCPEFRKPFHRMKVAFWFIWNTFDNWIFRLNKKKYTPETYEDICIPHKY